MNSNQCPFAVGDEVIYKPSSKGYASDVMSTSDGRLIPGEKYVICEVQENLYVVVNGYKHPGGGIYWTEFTLVL